MDNDVKHDRSNTNDALNDVNEDPLNFLDGFDESILPLQPPASVPNSCSLPAGQPSSQATLPVSFERLGGNPGPILPLDGGGHAHSFSVSFRDPKIECSGPRETPSQEQEQSGSLLGAQEPDHGLPTTNVSPNVESALDSALVHNHVIDENVIQSEGFASAPFNSGTSLNPNTIPRTLNEFDLNRPDPLFGQNSPEVQAVTYPGGHTTSNAYPEGLHAARVLQDMMQESPLSLPVASSQQAPFQGPVQQNQPAIPTQEYIPSEGLKENHVNPFRHAVSAQIVPKSSDQLLLQANLPVHPNFNAHRQAASYPSLYNVGNISLVGSNAAGPSHLPQRNPSSTITVPGFVNSKVLPDIVIDRTLLEKASNLEKGFHKSREFELFCQLTRRKYRASKRIPVGGTMRRRPDLIKPIENLEDFGYPSCDRMQVQKLLDTTPGLDRATVEALKLLVISQLDRIRQGALEALHQLSAILIDHLRFRIMAQTDILDLQCQVVDRFVVARNCVLERYSHYVKSRRWIENRSTNQRRGCLTHQQNNIMRMWLYQNFKNPYPDEEEKAYIVEETKMSMEQVNNWLINARSRFWKPAMDYFERETLEIKMSVFIRHRMRMTPNDRAKAVKVIGSPSTHREIRDEKSSS